MARARRSAPLWALVPALALLACGGGGEETAAERGRRAYVANCLACHHTDPALEGSLGPPVAGSSAELIEARVLRAEYPPGYAPKRDTGLMPAQPFLADQVADLAAYLESVPTR